ncbi:MAG: hypothetical protein ACXU81_10225 [Myxococcaceae bacterium]
MMRQCLAVSLLLLAGCSTVPAMRNLSAGQLGCSPEEISISQAQTYGQTASWAATCRGKQYWCSAGGGKESINTSCREDASAATAPVTSK